MNHMGCPKTEFSRRGFMIGIAGLTFAVAAGREKIREAPAATEGADVSGTPFNPWVWRSYRRRRRDIDHGAGDRNGERVADFTSADSGRGTGRRLVQSGRRAVVWSTETSATLLISVSL